MRIVGFDFETRLMRPGLLAPPPVCTSWADERQAWLQHCVLEPDAVEAEFERALTDEEVCLVGARVAFDAAVAMERWPRLVPLFFEAYAADRVVDCQINQMLIDIAGGCLGGYVDHNGKWHEIKYSLAALEKRLLKIDRSAQKTGPDIWRLRYQELEDVPIESWPTAASEYAIDDAIGARDVCAQQFDMQPGLLANAPAQARAALALHLMSCWGVRTHAEGIEYLREFVTTEFNELTEMLIEQGLLRRNGSRDTKKAKQRMWDAMKKLGLKPRLTKTGLKLRKERGDSLSKEEHQKYTSLNADACESCGDVVLEGYAKRTTLASIVKTKIPKLLRGVRGPIQADFNVLVESGRTSCREGRLNGYQLQNPSRTMPIRQCFKARPGYLYIDNDYSSLEMCTFAEACQQLVGHSRLGQLLNDGLDPHLDFGARMIGISYEEARERKRDDDVKNARQAAKPANFGFPGGMGPKGFVTFARGYKLFLTEEEAKAMREQWIDNYPEARDYFRLVSALCGDMGVCTVEQLFVGRYRGLTPYTAACNSFFQGLGADVAKEGMWAVTRACYDSTQDSPLFGTRPWNFVHDQILAETPGYESLRGASSEQIVAASDAAKAAAQLMVEHGNKYLPHFPVKCDPALSQVWMKGVETILDRDENVIAYDIAKRERFEAYYPGGALVDWG